jgi:DNA-binding LytR/AlgR family response regulator
MRVLIIEDELPAAQKLERLLKEIDNKIEIVEFLESVEQSINWIAQHAHPDLIMMDIQLSDGLCFEIFENIEISIPVIFTTAYDEYALRAFKVNSVDYLLKPVDPHALSKALYKFNNIHGEYNTQPVQNLLSQIRPKTKERFLIRIGEHFRSVQTSDIACFYIIERCTFLSTANNKSYPLDYSLDQVEKLVDTNKFFRINRNYIINIAAIKDIITYSSSRLKLILKDWSEKDEILVSRERVKIFKEWMDR